jgi:hypothetical protein
MKIKKRGQVTLFVIIGLVILFSTLIVLYIRSIDREPTEPFVVKDNVNDFVEQCLFQLTQEAVIKLGQQGGYIEMEGIDKVTAEYAPFESEILSMYNGKLHIPYWFYQDSTELDKTQMPELIKSYEEDYSIQWQLENYISKKIKICLNDFEVFEAQGMKIIDKGTISTEVIIAEGDVNVKLNYPIEIKKDEDDIENRYTFVTSVPVRLGRMYRLAKEIRDYEMENVFLEKHTMNMISAFSRVDNDYLPPMYGGLEFGECSGMEYWMYNSVNDDLNEMLIANVPFLHIAETNFNRIIINDEDNKRQKLRQATYDQMIHQVSENSYPMINVDFSYRQSFPMDLDLGTYGILQPNRMDMDLIFSYVCMFEYKFAYNLKYPVLITLTDSMSKVNNREFRFQFPMQVVLKDNYPRIRYSDVFPEPISVRKKTECDLDQRISAPMTINVLDDMDKGIDGVSIYFQCGPSMIYQFHANGTLKNISTFAKKCSIGATKNGVYEGKFPQCKGGGMISIKRNGYLSKSEAVGDMLDESRTLTFTLDQIYEKKVNVKKIFVKPPTSYPQDSPGVVMDGSDVKECNLNDDADILQAFEQAIVKLTKTDQQNGELKYPSVVFFDPKNSSTIKIAPGTYTVDITLFRNERFNGEMTFKKNSQTKLVPAGAMGGEKEIFYPDEDLLLPMTISGGAYYNWTVTKEELLNAETIIFNLFDEGQPKVIEQIGTAMAHREKCSELNYNRIKPNLT